MSATIFTGFTLAGRIEADARKTLASLPAATRTLAVLQVGATPAAIAYVDRLRDACGRIGLSLRRRELAADASLQQVLAAISDLNAEADVVGILPLLPFPADVPLTAVAAAMDPGKDVDGLHPLNAGRVAQGLPGIAPATASAAACVARELLGDLRGCRATVVGASTSVGRPLAQRLLDAGATVTIAHVDTRDLVAACAVSELLCVAVGRPGLITASHVRPGAVVIDIGINQVTVGGARRIVGDADLDSVTAVARIITAVPDGVGPVTAATLLETAAHCAARSAASPTHR